MAVKEDASARGELMAAALATSWRQTPNAPEFSVSDLASVTPLLLESGAGALAWRRVRNSHLQATPAAAELQQAYRLHAIQAARHEINIREVLETVSRCKHRIVTREGLGDCSHLRRTRLTLLRRH